MYHCYNCGRAVPRGHKHCSHCKAYVFIQGYHIFVAGSNGFGKSWRAKLRDQLRARMGR